MTALHQPRGGASRLAETAPDAVVSVRDLSISYAAGRREVPVVRGVSFEVRAGRALGLVGESGSGKSTVARTLLAHLRSGSRVVGGSVHVAGDDVFALDDRARRALRGGTAALVAQNAGQALTPSMRVGRQLREALESHGLPGGHDRVLELVRHVRLPDPETLVRRYPHQLSGGQQQRVAIAMAIAARPRVLVLDEPTTALDVVTQAAVLELIRDLAEELDMAIVLVSHDLGVVSTMADEIAVMRDGVIVEHAPTAELFASPRDPYTRELLASIPRVGGVGSGSGSGGRDSGSERRVTRERVSSLGTRLLERVSRVVSGADTAPPAGAGAGDAAAARAATAEEPRSVQRTTKERGVLNGTGFRGGAGEPVVTARDLVVRYGRGLPAAVDGVSFEIGRRETLAVVGESGSGKSTLAAALAGLIPAESGAFAFRGADGVESDLTRPVAGRSTDVRRAVQLIFQNADTSLNPRRTVGAAIARPLKLFTGSSSPERVAELLVEVGLPADFASRLPAQLSGGQRQRVGIARALAAGPELVIADEITTALDVRVQADVLDLLTALRDEKGLSCLFISHDLAVVRGVADRVAVMTGGRIVEIGPADAVFRGPNHPYTRTLLEATLDPGATELPGVGDARPRWRAVDGWDDHGDGHRVARWESA
ncbi:peptide/nickel transport system ATP-binding protein [Frigoribacterium sp. PhB160]|uniref:dipeptide ABC transporter ATP-binding protein n=1 Tax=Frigoribacterium sp. PhB160 TaxID=2485192 RepID=UPI000F4777B7|nr:ABC transporter ATP-binding protein [Frigoribacterium sp. PhB160]ROS62640.1 peptide/nickel transport system ATP-binding protein [Frigoribacterium sp. PhB160]